MSEPNSAKSPSECKGAGAAGPPAGELQRRHERAPLFARLSIYELDGDGNPGVPYPADAEDISRSGIGVRSRRMYYTDRVLLVRIPLRGGGACFKHGVVRSSQYAGGGMYHVGIEFRAMPDEGRLAAWMDSQRDSAIWEAA